MSDQPETTKHPSISSDSSQVLLLSLQMQALALVVEEIRGRVARIEQHLKLLKDDNNARAALSRLDGFGDPARWTRRHS